jgi:hypothetical protein
MAERKRSSGAVSARNVTVAEALQELRWQLTEFSKQPQADEHRFVTRNVEVELAISFVATEVGWNDTKGRWFLDTSDKPSSGEPRHKVKLVLDREARYGTGTLIGESAYNLQMESADQYTDSAEEYIVQHEDYRPPKK